MGLVKDILNAAPGLALFAALPLGQALGRGKIGSFSLGSVAGSLMVPLVIGQLGVNSARRMILEQSYSHNHNQKIK